MESAEPLQVFVRNEQGKVWGPLTLQSVELLIDSGMIPGRVQVSKDGLNFAFPGRFPGIRRAFPRELWGEVIEPGDDDEVRLGAELPPELLAPAEPAAPPLPGDSAVPLAGPGVFASTQARSAVPTASSPKPEATLLEGPPPAGELAQCSPIRLYYLAASSDQTGLLSLTLRDRRIEIHFRRGNPESVASSHPDDALDRFLLAHGLATAEQLAQAEVEQDRFGGDLLAALFGLRILDPSSAFSHLGQRATGLLHQALAAEEGRFAFERAELAPHQSFPLGNRWAVLTEQVRRLPLQAVKRRLERSASLALLKSGGRVPVDELRLTPQELRALSHVDGVRSLRQLCLEAPQDVEHLLRVAFLLHELEVLTFAGPAPARPSGPAAAPASPRPATPPSKPAPAAPPKRPPAPKPAAAPPRAPPPSQARPSQQMPAPAAMELPQLQATAAKLKQQDHFEVLGLPRTADTNAVKLAYFKLAKLYHPDTVATDAPPELAKLKEDIFARIGEAYRTLGDEQARADYLVELETGGGDSGMDIAKLLAAEERFRRGMNLVKARKFPEAVAALDEAIEANSEEGEFYAWRGYARFFTHPEKSKGLAAAVPDLNLCLKKNERCAQAHYFLGHLAKLCNDSGGALKSFRQCLELDPNHIDAQRELRLLKK